MKIACVTTFDLTNPASWPKRHLGLYGASAQITRTLQNEETAIEYLGALSRKRSPLTRLKWLTYRNFHQDFYSWADPAVSRHYAHQIEDRLSHSDADILLCQENAIPLAMVRPDRPMVLWTDATLGSLIDFYPYLSNLCWETRHNLLKLEQRVLERCSLIVLTSQWAARRAHDLYGTPLSKIEIIPRGSNQARNLPSETIGAAIEQRASRPCKLLFVGVEWQRKGGDVALRVAAELNRQGIETELHVVGCVPPVDSQSFVKVHGFIDRTTPAGQAEIAALFQSAHFLIFPTKADTFGVVISEAASFGVPALATEVGGITSVVKADVTGKTFALESDPSEYCRFVAGYMADIKRYQSLAYSTLEHYQKYMSWSAIGDQARVAFRNLLAE
ncbi:glycosyltransferase family 4 protein [Leptolyngbya sp. BC1307]|uniref:glycosyltransferase family 4 protein n=1 Tax=Leptolyngbya sp. BC1307 TaxID=2029589 RepID=UPI000EFC272F|nr:glycosyltransferase family 4 protein [Leptolyngbya sp. BC1307]